jgi:hypothetical protein
MVHLGIFFLFGMERCGQVRVYYYSLPQKDRDQGILLSIIQKYIYNTNQLDVDSSTNLDLLGISPEEQKIREKRVHRFSRGRDFFQKVFSKKRMFAVGFVIVLYRRPEKSYDLLLTKYTPCGPFFINNNNFRCLKSLTLNGQEVSIVRTR